MGELRTNAIPLEARPTFDEVMAARADRMATMRRVVDALTAEELERITNRKATPGYPDEPHTVGQCVRVVLGEECEHYRYATRDLAMLETESRGQE